MVLVAGGLGMIGSLVASWLVRQSVSEVVLLGRSGRPGADSAAVLELVGASGCSAAVTMVRCDVGSTEEVRALAAASGIERSLQVRPAAGSGSVVGLPQRCMQQHLRALCSSTRVPYSRVHAAALRGMCRSIGVPRSSSLKS